MRLATAAIGGLAALTALLLLRSCGSPEEDGGEPLIVIYKEPRYDTPPADPHAGRDRLLVMPLT